LTLILTFPFSSVFKIKALVTTVSYGGMLLGGLNKIYLEHSLACGNHDVSINYYYYYIHKDSHVRKISIMSTNL
jgi:hypothetical protein